MRELLWLVIALAGAWSKVPDLPPCPTNVQYLPQELPMHCRMTAGADSPFPGIMNPPAEHSLPPPFYQSPPPGAQPPPIPYPVPPFPAPLPGMPMPMPGMPMPMPVPGPAHKLPVIVMPFYSPDPSHNKRSPPHKPRQRRPPAHKKRAGLRPRRPYETDSSDSSEPSESSDTSDEGFWQRRSLKRMHKKMKAKRRRLKKEREPKNLLTPMIQYVTKDGYVIFEKEISKTEAKDWLTDKNVDNQNKNVENNDNKVQYKEIDDLTNQGVPGPAEEPAVEEVTKAEVTEKPQPVRKRRRKPLKISKLMAQPQGPS